MTATNLTSRRRIEPQLLFLCLLFISFSLAFYPVWRQLISYWYHMEEYSHGFFIVPISLYVAWKKKDSLISGQGSPKAIGFFLVILTLLIYTFSRIAAILTLQSVSMVLFIGASAFYLLGASGFKQLMFPSAFLLFMIPVPSQIYSSMTIPLQLFVSKASEIVVKLISIPVLREGNVIHLPGHTLQIVQACSGLRSLTSLLALSAILAYFTLNSNLLRAILFAAGAPIAILVNIIRIVITIIFFYFFNYDLTNGNLHTIFGIFIYIIALFLIFMVGKGLSRWDKSEA